MQAYQLDLVKVKPVREIRLSQQGALLASSRPRYDDLTSYVVQLGAPLSQLPGAGVLTFADPISDLVVLVETREIDWCGRCAESLENCCCPF